MSVTLAALLAGLAREYAAGIAGTATSATPTTLVDPSDFGGARAGGGWPNGSPVRITSGAAIGQNTTKSGAIDPSTGTIPLSPAVSGLTGTPTFVIADQVEHVDRLIEAINRCLIRRCSRFLKVPLTDVPDGDFLDVATANHWSAVTATLSYVTLTMANGVLQRCLQVLTSAASGYAQSDAIPVEPLESRNFQVFMRNANASPTVANSAVLVLMDLTHGTVITPQYSIGAASTTSHAFVTARGTYSVPAGCSQVAWRLQGTENPATVQFGALIDNAFYQRTFSTQPHLLTEDDFARLYVAVQGGDQSSGPEAMSFEPRSMDGVSFSDMGYGQAVEFDSNPGFPLFYDEYSFFPPFASPYVDTDTTDADEELVLCGAAVELYTMLKNRSHETPQVSRGRIVPTSVMLKLEDAQQRWDSPRLSRLRAPRRLALRRAYNRAVYA